MTETPIPSPCVGVCQIHRDTGFCLGCFRTIREVVQWPRLDNAKRVAILEELRARRQAAGRDRRRMTRRRRLAQARAGE